MIDYYKINSILASDLKSANIDDLIYIQRIVKVILCNFKSYPDYEFRNSIKVYNSLKLVYAFLENINPNYAKEFNQKIYDGSICLDYNFDIGLSYIDNEYGKRMLIPIRHDIHDSFTMVHEFMHDLNLKPNSLSVSRHLFTECFSILGEMLYHDYLTQNHKYVHDATVNMTKLFWSIYRINMKNDFEINLYLNYLKDGQINENTIQEICINDYEYSYQVYYSLVDALQNGTFALDVDQRYSIGLLFACYMHNRIINNPKKICELFELNDIINDISIEELMNYLDLKVEDRNNIILTYDSIKKLEKTYQSELKRIG